MDDITFNILYITMFSTIVLLLMYLKFSSRHKHKWEFQTEIRVFNEGVIRDKNKLYYIYECGECKKIKRVRVI